MHANTGRIEFAEFTGTQAKSLRVCERGYGHGYRRTRVRLLEEIRHVYGCTVRPP